MGINWFIEGYPTPMVVRGRLTRPVRSFSDLNEITQSLKEVDRFLFTWWYKNWPGFSRRRNREVFLLSFRLTSPAEFTILADPAWIAVLLTILTGYRDIKENVKEISEDVNKLLKSVRGLTLDEIELLRIAIRLTVEKFAKYPKVELNRLTRKFDRIRSRLIGKSDSQLDIEIRRPDRDDML